MKSPRRILLPACVLAFATAGILGAGKPGVHTKTSTELPPDTIVYTPDAYKIGRKGDLEEFRISDSLLAKFAAEANAIKDSTDTLPRILARDTIKVPDSLRYTDPFRFKYYLAIVDSLTHREVVDSLKRSSDSLKASANAYKISSDTLKKSIIDRSDTALLNRVLRDSIYWHRDSLHALLDSLDYTKIDSIYKADSSYAAKLAFEKWYNSLSRTERKEYDYKMRLPIIRKQRDSIENAKKKAKALKDSITKATPRILETYAFGKEEYYKRLLTWKTDSDFHDLSSFDYDTSYNYRFYDYAWQREDVNASWLGVSGSPVQYYNYFKRRGREGVDFYSAYEPWSLSMETVTHFNTKTPYTELCYYGTLLGSSAKESDNLHLFTTQNITPELNFSLMFDRFGGGGILENEETKNKTALVDINYLGKKYMAHAGFISNSISMGENGGVRDVAMIRDTIIEPREIEVMFKDAHSKLSKKTFYLEQQVRIPMTFIEDLVDRIKHGKDTTSVSDSTLHQSDSTKTEALTELVEDPLEDAEGQVQTKSDTDSLHTADTLNTDVTTIFLGHTTEWSRYERSFHDNIGSSDRLGRAFYNNAFRLNPTESFDTLAVNRLENKIFLRLQPWADDGLISKLDVGVGDRLMQYRDTSLNLGRAGKHSENSFYLYAGAEGQWRDLFKWRAKGDYTLLGYNFGDFGIEADASLNFYPFRKAKRSPLTLYANFKTSLQEPNYYQRVMNINHYGWDNDFKKISETRIGGGIRIPYWGLEAEFNYGLLYNNIYYDSLSVVRQNDKAMSVLSAMLRKDLVFGPLHLENRAIFQYSSSPAVVPVPSVALNLRWYLQFVLQWNESRTEKILEMQVGANAYVNSKWNSPAWNPALGVFYNQNVNQYNNGPYFDVFVNMQWKRAVLFIKYQNAGRGWPMKKLDYFSSDRHIVTEPGMNGLKLGIYWPFYMDTHSLSSKDKKH